MQKVGWLEILDSLTAETCCLKSVVQLFPLIRERSVQNKNNNGSEKIQIYIMCCVWRIQSIFEAQYHLANYQNSVDAGN